MEQPLPEPPDRETLRRVQAWHKVPPLRIDLRFVRSSVAGLFRIVDPNTGKFVELYELECLVAQAMDGQRTIDDLTAFARMYNPTIARRQIELLLVQLLHLDMLEEEPIKPGHGKVIPLPVPKPQQDEFASFRNELVLDLQRNEAIAWSDETSPERRKPLFEPARRVSQVIKVSNDDLDDNTNISVGDESFRVVDDDGADDLDDNTNLHVGANPFAVLEQNRDRMVASGEMFDDAPLAPPPRPSGLFDSPDEEDEADEPAAAPEVAAVPVTTPRQAESEQEDLFQQAQVAKKAWYKRTWVRVLGVLVLLVAVSAIVERPLYITSECGIIPNQRAYVRSPIGGVLAEILVDEGTAVKKGDVIARLDDRNLKADRLKAVAEVERIGADLQRLRKGARPEEISQQRAVVGAKSSAVAFAAKEVKRRQKMLQEGVGSRQAVEEAQADYQIKSNAYAEAVAALKLLQSGTRKEEIGALEANLKRAQSELDFVEQQLREMVVIRAPMDGVVLTPKFRERLHENVEAGGLVCEIADTSVVRAEIFVPAREVDSIAVGMPVVVKVESYPLNAFEGKVNFIAPAVEQRNKVSVVRVVATLDNKQGLLRQDMTGYGEIECGDKSLLDLATRRLLRWIRVRFLI
ncbi:MAG TPA: HlyD family efflux transporter periplasmic adaptor subunit [Kofleriaceae bacterium]|nr:HlyD family efflux transporter periplasmic adaptor subunit [Kofleriaceae bacterium]